MDRVAFTVPGQPVGKGRPRFAVRRGRGGKTFVQTYTPKETTEYEARVWIAARAVVGFQHRPWTGPVVVVVRVFNADRRRRDLDNIVKCITDALNKKIFDDDFRIDEIHATKRYDKASPRVEVELEHLVEGGAR